MLDFLNEPNWWCLFVLLLIAFLLGWFLSLWVNNSKYKKALAACIDREKDSGRVKTPMAKTTFTTSDSTKQNVTIQDRNGISVETENPKLNFERFGKADASQKDNLKRISGVGPFIEGKLNSIGIYTFDQISKFTKEDIDAVTLLIQFFPGRIERDDWRQQATDLKNK